ALLADLPVHVAQPGIGVVVEVFAEYERDDELLEFGAPVAAERPGLQPRVALPRPPLGEQVLLERRERRRKRTAVAVRAQAHVDAEHEALRGDVAERGNDPAAETIEELLVGQRPGA